MRIFTSLLAVGILASGAGVLAGRVRADDQDRSRAERLSSSGNVVDDRGRPIAGAMVYLREIAALRDRARMQQQDYSDILAQTTTDADGRFVFKEVAAEPMRLSRSNTYKYPWNLVVSSKGHGFAWHTFRAQREEELTIVLRPQASLRGRLLDAKKKPAVGVPIHVNAIDQQLDPDPRKRTVSPNELQLQWSRLPFGAVTDADGEFILKGLPPGLHISLVASDPRYARKYLSCATIAKDEIDHLNTPMTVPADARLLPDGFTAVLEPSRVLCGTLTYADSGKPVAGARVQIGIYLAQTDLAGRYSLSGFHARTWPIFVTPPDGSNYLASRAEAALKADMVVLEQNFALQRGSVITGELRDKDSEERLRVPFVIIQYRGEGAGVYASTQSKADGSFRIVVPPGKGKLFTWDDVPGSVPRMLESGMETAFKQIHIKAGEVLTGQHLHVHRGMVVQGRIVDPAGEPVAAVFYGATEQPPSGADGSFTLRGLSRQHKSHFLVVNAKRSLAAKVIVEPQQGPQPVRVEVKLQPTQTVGVRVIDERKQPVTGAHISLLANIKLTETPTGYSVRPLPIRGPAPTDSEGKFILPAMVVDGSYTVQASAPGYAPVRVSFRVEPGKETKVPDLVLLASNLVIDGVVVDPSGKPVEGVQVVIQPRNHTLANNHDMETTKADGRFHFHGLSRGDYRLMADLRKATGKIDKNGWPVHTNEARTELQVASGQENIRVILHLPQDVQRASALVGKSAPEFAVVRWLNRDADNKEGFKAKRHVQHALLVAFLDEAKPSQRVVQLLNELHQKHSGKGLTIVRVYETPVAEQELAKRSPTPAALVAPGLVAGGFSDAAQRYGVRANPTLFLIDSEGVVRHADIDPDGLEKRITNLLPK